MGAGVGTFGEGSGLEGLEGSGLVGVVAIGVVGAIVVGTVSNGVVFSLTVEDKIEGWITVEGARAGLVATGVVATGGEVMECKGAGSGAGMRESSGGITGGVVSESWI